MRNFGQLRFLTFLFIAAVFPAIAHAAATLDPFKAKTSYEDVFTRDIYNQQAVLKQLQPRIDAGTITDQDVDQELCRGLHTAKQKQLDAVIVDRIRTKVELLKTEAKNDAQRAMWGDILNALGTAPLCAAAAPPVAIAGAVVTGVRLLGSIALNVCYDAPEVAKIKTEIAVLLEDIKFRQQGLTTEIISNLEIDYVKKKRKINNPTLIVEIEKTLIDIRKGTNSPFETVFRNFLERALTLPLRPHPIAASFAELQQRFRGDTFFEAFSSETRTQFEEVLSTVFYAATAPDSSALPLREVCFGWGNPASGKSTGFRRLAEHTLGVPCFEVTLRDGSDLMRDNLEGVDRYRLNADVGWLVTPLLMPEAKTQQSVNNPFLIINDFDRILFSPTRGPAALNFLLDYLDPSKRSVQHPYFKTRIDISRLTIIVTSNRRLPPGNGAADDIFAALRSRVREMEFTDFAAQQQASICTEYAAQACVFYQVPTYFQLTFREDKLHIAVNTQSFGSMQGIDFQPLTLPASANLREAQRNIRTAVSKWNVGLLAEAKTSAQQAQQAAAPAKFDLYKRAILCGDVCEAPYQLSLCYKALRASSGASKWEVMRRQWAEMAAKNGHAQAAHDLGELFYGPGPLHDTALAEQWMRTAAQKKHAEARFWLGKWYRRGSDLDQARDYMIILVKEADSQSPQYKDYLQELYVLAEAFEQKQGISLANQNAIQCFRAAADRDHARSQFKLGWLNFHESKFTEAKVWFDSAAASGDAYALNYLGVMYSRGMGVAIDRAKCRKLELQASTIEESVFTIFNLGYPNDNGAATKLHNIVNPVIAGWNIYRLQHGTQSSFREYFRTRSESKYYGMDSDLACLIGHMYYVGFGFNRDTNCGKDWYKFSTDLGNLLGKKDWDNATSCVVM